MRIYASKWMQLEVLELTCGAVRRGEEEMAEEEEEEEEELRPPGLCWG